MAGVWLLLSLWLSVCLASNLDTSFPLVKVGEDGSLFGLSVALHLDLKTHSYLQLVGAPREKAELNVQANRTGGVYSCPINADQSDCSRIKLIDPDQSLSDEMFEDMWLGVSVASQGPPGGRVLACGHRFVKLYGAFQLRHMIGRCYIRGNNFQFNVSDLDWQNPDQACSHLGEVSKEAMCTMGISSSITQTEVIVGSPGSFEWHGNVHASWMNPDVQFDTRRSSLKKVKDRNIYIGYSVTQALHLLSKDSETIVTGSPKDSKQDARGSVLLLVKQDDLLVIQQTLRGEQTGSYFGNALATSDLNNDGWNDLLVGAPFYFERQQEVGGAVYVYMNVGGRFDSRPSVVLKGPAWSAFGMAVCATGDLNQDGFQDFAVGAPFHETGSVMIWTGSKDGVSTEPSQVIKGSTVSPRFRSFGYSLSGGFDVDGNKYPDLMVGSLDDTVALLRTRPVIHLNKTLTVSPAIVDPQSCDFCIQVKVCFSYMFSIGAKSDKDNITILYTLTADVTSLKPRLRFHDNRQSVYSGKMSMPKKRCETLRVGLLTPIRDKVEPLEFSLEFSLHEEPSKNINVVQDLKHYPVLSQTPKPVTKKIHIQKACGDDNRCSSNLQMTAHFTDENQKPLPTHEDKQMWYYNGSTNRLLLEVNVSNTPSLGRPAEDAHNAVLSINIPPLLIYSGVRTKFQGDVHAVVECSVKDTVLICELGNPFKSNEKVEVLIIFQPSKISLDTRVIQSVLQLSTLSEQTDLLPVSVTMLVDYSLQTSLILINPPGFVSFSGHVIGESAMNTTEDVGSMVLFTLQIHINGKPLGPLGNLEVEFDWPIEVSNGKWLLYLTEIQVNGTSNSHCAPPGKIINPLNLKLPKKTRRRRSAEEELKEKKESQGKKNLPVLNLQGQKRKSYTLDCANGANCVRFVCPLLNMNNSATLTVRARLWNSTMIEDYSDARTVLVRGKATLKLQTNKPTISMEPQSTEIEVHVYPDMGQQLDSNAPLWIIVVSVLAGVILLALICLLLWKCGFFKRASTRELYEAKTEKAHMKSQPSEHERLDQEL
ncbi:integrin alpha-3-like [Notolabrus celidotus]|uniref:integrin alpha-3-like n=1 Tax=Notolabrus celidotus TaxID=1203425 RepID=UPI0014903243|nr:integrin alpha-3-like [Notolabrus celidotus]